MTRQLDILNDVYLFDSTLSNDVSLNYKIGKYVLNYKLVFIHVLFKIKYVEDSDSEYDLISTGCMRDIAEYILDKLNNTFDPIEYSTLFSFLPIYNQNGRAYVFIDHSHGCYPLIINSKPNSNDDPINLRLDAVCVSLKSIIKHADDLSHVLKQEQNWSQELQNKILKIAPDNEIL